MTNTISSIFAATSTGITSVCDGWVAIGITIGLGLAGFALFKKFAPQKKKVV